MKFSSIFLIDCVAGKREPSIGRSRSTAEMLQGSGSNLWEMYEAERYEWSACYENALHQLHLPEMYYIFKRARGSTRWIYQKVCISREACVWTIFIDIRKRTVIIDWIVLDKGCAK